jgi:TolB-like protein/DNA-binding SARP family transcriptional activator
MLSQSWKTFYVGGWKPMGSLQLKLLGGFEACGSSGQIVEVSGKKNQALLAFLAVNAGKKLSREKLADLLWSDRGHAQARSSLRQALGTLRHDLTGIDPAPLIIDGDSVGSDVSALSTDVVEFERLAPSAELGDLRRAAVLYAGDLVDGLAVRDPAFEEWLSFERTRLRDIAIMVLDKLSAQLIGAERIAVAKRLVALDPVREASHRTLMRAYAAQGHPDQAIRQFEICRDTLQRVLQVEPSKETEALNRQIVEDRRGRPSVTSPMTSIVEASEPSIPSVVILPRVSIAVLPFTNMSGDPEQQYFSAGITEDIVTDLSKVSHLNVISPSTVFAFNGSPVDINQIASQLKVEFVLEGSVRKAGGRVRITSQLIDAKNASHLWAERYDRDLNDIFTLQDEISQAIVASLKVKLLPEEKRAIVTRSTLNPNAYELYLQARHYQQQRGARYLEIALRFCNQALEIDPSYSRAWASVALCRSLLYIRGRSTDSGLSAAEKAISIDPNLAEAHAAMGRALAELGRDNEALAAHEVSVRLDPDSFDVQYYFGRTCLQFGHHEAAIQHLERAVQLEPTDYFPLSLASQSYELLGRKDEATHTVRRALELIEREIAHRPDNVHAIVQGAWALGYLGESEHARVWARRAMAIDPDDPLDRYNLCCTWARMNERDLAFDLLEACAPMLSPEWINWIKHDNDLIPLRDHPRYLALMARGEARLRAFQSDQLGKAD